MTSGCRTSPASNHSLVLPELKHGSVMSRSLRFSRLPFLCTCWFRVPTLSFLPSLSPGPFSTKRFRPSRFALLSRVSCSATPRWFCSIQLSLTCLWSTKWLRKDWTSCAMGLVRVSCTLVIRLWQYSYSCLIIISAQSILQARPYKYRRFFL